MIVVSDTSCISNLLSVGLDSLLPRLFGKVLIPPAVEHELLRFHSSLPALLRRVVPTDEARLSGLRRELDPGTTSRLHDIADALSVRLSAEADRETKSEQDSGGNRLPAAELKCDP